MIAFHLLQTREGSRRRSFTVLRNAGIGPWRCRRDSAGQIARRGGNWEKSGVRSENKTCQKHDCALDNILKLANVSGPGIVHQQIHHFLTDGVNFPAKPVHESFQEKFHEQRNLGWSGFMLLKYSVRIVFS